MFKTSWFPAACAALVLALPLLPAHAAEPAKAADKIVMYATQTCGYCAKARAWFTEHKLQWDERDIEASASARAEWKSLGGVGTPLIVVNGKRFAGFMPTEIEAELAK